MTAIATPLPTYLQAVAEPSEDQRWAEWLARGLAHDARSARRLRLVFAAVIVIGIVVASALVR